MCTSTLGLWIAWAVIIAVVIGNLAGYWFNLYEMLWWFDRVLHTSTLFGLTLWLALVVLAPGLRGGHPVIQVLMLAGCGLALGALWEVLEWAFDQVAPGDVIKGKNDTLIDIVLDAVGAVAAGLLTIPLLRDRPSRLEGRACRSPEIAPDTIRSA